jgi:DNA polymerase sigma
VPEQLDSVNDGVERLKEEAERLQLEDAQDGETAARVLQAEKQLEGEQDPQPEDDAKDAAEEEEDADGSNDAALKRELQEAEAFDRQHRDSIRALCSQPFSAAVIAPLQAALLQLLASMRLTEQERRARGFVVSLLQAELSAVLPGARMDAYGSCGSQVDVRGSDVDLCIVSSENRDAVSILRQLRRRLGTQRARRDWHSVLALLNARVPLLKLVHSGSGVAVDISMSSDFTAAKTRLVAAYCRMDERALALVQTVKWWAKRRGLGDGASGGLNSFGWTLLCIAFMQQLQPPLLPNLQQTAQQQQQQQSQPTAAPASISTTSIRSLLAASITPQPPLLPVSAVLLRPLTERLLISPPPIGWQSQCSLSLAQLLVLFFLFYTESFDWRRMVVSVRSGRTLPAADWKATVQRRNGRRQGTRLCIEDPFVPSDNVGRGVTAALLVAIQLEMRRALHKTLTGLGLDRLGEERLSQQADTPRRQTRCITCSLLSRVSRLCAAAAHVQAAMRRALWPELRDVKGESRGNLRRRSVCSAHRPARQRVQ